MWAKLVCLANVAKIVNQTCIHHVLYVNKYYCSLLISVRLHPVSVCPFSLQPTKYDWPTSPLCVWSEVGRGLKSLVTKTKSYPGETRRKKSWFSIFTTRCNVIQRSQYTHLVVMQCSQYTHLVVMQCLRYTHLVVMQCDKVCVLWTGGLYSTAVC